jgi:hypothetical protein
VKADENCDSGSAVYKTGRAEILEFTGPGLRNIRTDLMFTLKCVTLNTPKTDFLCILARIKPDLFAVCLVNSLRTSDIIWTFRENDIAVGHHVIGGLFLAGENLRENKAWVSFSEPDRTQFPTVILQINSQLST